MKHFIFILDIHDCVLRFPDISTSLFSHAGVSVNSAENNRGI